MFALASGIVEHCFTVDTALHPDEYIHRDGVDAGAHSPHPMRGLGGVGVDLLARGFRAEFFGREEPLVVIHAAEKVHRSPPDRAQTLQDLCGFGGVDFEAEELVGEDELAAV